MASGAPRDEGRNCCCRPFHFPKRAQHQMMGLMIVRVSAERSLTEVCHCKGEVWEFASQDPKLPQELTGQGERMSRNQPAKAGAKFTAWPRILARFRVLLPVSVAAKRRKRQPQIPTSVV